MKRNGLHGVARLSYGAFVKLLFRAVIRREVVSWYSESLGPFRIERIPSPAGQRFTRMEFTLYYRSSDIYIFQV